MRTVYNMPLRELVESYCEAAEDFSQSFLVAIEQEAVEDLVVRNVYLHMHDKTVTGTLAQLAFRKDILYWRLNANIQNHLAVLYETTEDSFLDFVAISMRHYDEAEYLHSILHRATCRLNRIRESRSKNKKNRDGLKTHFAFQERVEQSFLGNIPFEKLEDKILTLLGTQEDMRRRCRSIIESYPTCVSRPRIYYSKLDRLPLRVLIEEAERARRLETTISALTDHKDVTLKSIAYMLGLQPNRSNCEAIRYHLRKLRERNLITSIPKGRHFRFEGGEKEYQTLLGYLMARPRLMSKSCLKK